MAKRIKSGGRKKGSLNKITMAFKEAVKTVYDEIGGDEAFAEWAKENKTDFYKIAARLIPTEISKTNNNITVVVHRGDSEKIIYENPPVIEQNTNQH